MELVCAVLDDYQGVALQMADWDRLVGRVRPIVFRDHFASGGELVAALRDCQIVVTLRERVRFPDAVLRALPNLRLLVASGMRNTAIDLRAARDLGITVCGTSTSSSALAELTWALILALARNIVTEASGLSAGGRWQTTVGTDLEDACLGVVGLGRIGSRVARVATSFGMDVVAWSKNLTAEAADAAGVRLADSLDDLLAQADFVTIHLALSERTVGIIGARQIARMKRSAYLVNTARAAILDGEALRRALVDGASRGRPSTSSTTSRCRATTRCGKRHG